MSDTKPRRVPTRPYRIVRKERESEVITSFYLAPADGEPLASFEPGQFLTFQMEDTRNGGIARRNYSLSGTSDGAGHYRISVKREPAPLARPDLSPGLFSNHMHDRIEVGAELLARGPDGRFTLDTGSVRPVVLLSGGVGLTPLVAMTHALAKSGRPAWFVHACETGKVHALGREIRELAARSPNIRTHFCYRSPGPEDVLGRDYDSAGMITRELLQSLLPLDDYDVYLCGPAPFMQAIFALMIGLGVREERIRYEFFGPATLLRAEAKSETPPAVEAAPEPAPPATDTPMVTFAKTGKTVPWDPTFDNLLDFAESKGLDPAFSCRAGICSTCLCELPAGSVEYVNEPLDDPSEGMVLICCARPIGNVTLNL